MRRKWVLSGIAALLLSLSLIGCKLASTMYYSELKEYKAEMRLENNYLIIRLDNLPGIMVWEINPTYKDRNVYLVAQRISSGGGDIKEYRIKVSEENSPPSDIKKRIYWVNPDSSVNLLYPEYLK